LPKLSAVITNLGLSSIPQNVKDNLDIGDIFEIYGSEFTVVDRHSDGSETYYVLETPHGTELKAHEEFVRFMRVYPG
jgi:hypothetical protein